MNNEIQFDENRFKSLIDDFCESLGLSKSDIIEIDSSKSEFTYRKYYRYKHNKTLPFFFIELYNGFTKLLIDCKEKGKSKIYEFYDDETLEALKEIIHKSLKNQFEYLKSQIVYKDDRTTIIIRENDLDKSETLMYLYYENKLTSNKEIAFSKVGKRIVFKICDLDKFLATHRISSNDEIREKVNSRRY